MNGKTSFRWFWIAVLIAPFAAIWFAGRVERHRDVEISEAQQKMWIIGAAPRHGDVWVHGP